MTPGIILAEKYRIERELGSGGMAKVFQVVHLHLGERAAIKVLRSDMAHVQGIVERFSREARAMSRLKSEHVARVHDVGLLPSGEPYMVMEYLEGQDLSSTIEAHGPLAPQPAVDLILQACEAIAEAHARGIVHRDLKPSNLFLTTRADGIPTIKVLDFGISKLAHGSDEPEMMSLTHTQALLGSPLYMSPEQIASARDADARTDLWGLGIILYELLARIPPFQAQTLRHLQYQILHEQPQPLRELNPAVPPELELAILRCLAKEPEARFPDPGALATALRPFASKHGIPYVDRICGIVSRANNRNVPGVATSASLTGDSNNPSRVDGHAPTFDISNQGTSKESQTDPEPLDGTRGAWSETWKQSQARSRIGLVLTGVVGMVAVGILVLASVRYASNRSVADAPPDLANASVHPVPTSTAEESTDEKAIFAVLAEPDVSHSAAPVADVPPTVPSTMPPIRRSGTTPSRTPRDEPAGTMPQEPVKNPGGLFDTRK